MSYKKTLIVFFQQDQKFDLAGATVQVKDDTSPMKISVRMEPLDGVWFLSLSEYRVIDLLDPKFSGVTMGLSTENNVAMLLRKVSKRRCQQINNNVWDKGMETLDLEQSSA
jgi:hypothetical protein